MPVFSRRRLRLRVNNTQERRFARKTRVVLLLIGVDTGNGLVAERQAYLAASYPARHLAAELTTSSRLAWTDLVWDLYVV